MFEKTTALEERGMGVKLLENSVEKKGKAWREGLSPLPGPFWKEPFNEAFLCKPNCTVAWGSRGFLVGRDG